MAIFAIYRYKISSCEGEANLFGESDKEKLLHYASPEACFGSFFTTGGKLPLNVLKEKGTGKNKEREWASYQNDVLRVENGVALITVENNKVKHTTNNKKDVPHEHHPFCHVVIDNRPGRQIMAIVKNTAFDNKPEKVCGIFSQAFNNAAVLGQYHLKIEFTKCSRGRDDFWFVINDIRTKFNDSVCQIRMDFSGKNSEAQADPKDMVAIMQALSIKSESTAVLTLNAEGNGEVRLDELHDDLVNMANICLHSKGYDLTVKFRTFGLYRYGSDVAARFGVEDEVIDEFENGTRKMNFENPEGSFALIDWLDRITVLIENYPDEAPVQTGRKKRHRR